MVHERETKGQVTREREREESRENKSREEEKNDFSSSKNSVSLVVATQPALTYKQERQSPKAPSKKRPPNFNQ